MSAANLLSQSSFWIVNKSIAQLFKCNNTSLLLSELISKEKYFKGQNTIEEDGFFYATSKNIEESINISYHVQKICIKKLEDVGFIETKLKGIPAKVHFRVVENKISNFLNTGIINFLKLDVENIENYNSNNIEKENKGRNSPSEKFLFSNSENSGDSSISKEEAEIPKRGGGLSVEDVASKIENLLRSKMKSEISEILAKSDLDFPTLTRMFTDYWIYDKGRQFDSKNWKGMAESFRQWTTVAGKKEIPKKEVTSGIKSNDQMEKIIEYVERTKRDLKMTKDESASIKKFMAENDVSDTTLWDSTKSFVTGSGNTWSIWLRIVQREHRERFVTN